MCREFGVGPHARGPAARRNAAASLLLTSGPSRPIPNRSAAATLVAETPENRRNAHVRLRMPEMPARL